MCDKNCGENLENVCVVSPIGDIIITVCSEGLHRIFRSDISFQPNPQIKVKIKDQKFESKNKLINDSINWLSDYFQSGQQNGVPVPQFCPSVTRSDFKRNVWSTLMNGTKFGETISYSALAAISIGKPNASRAVGSAMKNNPFLLMVPCHRVVKKDGTIGNYSAGNSIKEWLISFEKQFIEI